MDHDFGAPAPSLNDKQLDRISEVLESQGPLAAVDDLCRQLRAAEDFQALFYALLLRKRVELGVSPFPNSPATELPAETHEAYETAIREAGRLVADLYLEKRQYARAWGFLRMLGEPERMRQVLEAYQPGDDDDTYAIVEIAWQQGVLPEKGFDIILDRHGICSAITLVGSVDLSANPPLRNYCVRRLVRALHEQLQDRLNTEITGRTALPHNATITQIVQAHPELFADDLYHIDISHLHSVVQMALQLPASEELRLAMELCDYGSRLSANLRGDVQPPFEGGYQDYRVYLQILAGEDVETGLGYFRAKLAEARANQDTYPAEVLVNLYLRLDRLPDALQLAREELADATRELTCPSVVELARQARDYAVLAEASRTKGDPVNFLAGLIAARSA